MTDTRTRTRFAVWRIVDTAASFRHRTRLVADGLTEAAATKRAAAAAKRPADYPARYVVLPDGETPAEHIDTPTPPFEIPGHPGYRTDR